VGRLEPALGSDPSSRTRTGRRHVFVMTPA
jgi:hypothetical protein